MLNVLVIGLGGVGTIAAYVLEKSTQAKVTAVLRSNFEAVEAEGFDIESVDHGTVENWRPSTISPSISSVSPDTQFDYILITTKCHPSKLPELISSLRPFVRPVTTSILLLQNGLDVEPPFAECFPSNPVLGGLSMIGSRLTSPNSILHEDPDFWKIGAFLHNTDALPAESQHASAQRFADVYNQGLADAIAAKTGAGCLVVNDVIAARWQKLLWNGTYNTLCTLLRIPVGELVSSPGKQTLLEPAMREMASIARAAGYGNAVTDETINLYLTDVSPDSPFRPSMLVDLDKGRPFELEVILGAPLRVAKEKGVQTPVLSKVYDLLSVLLWRVTELAGQN